MNDNYKYQNPESGKEVALREASDPRPLTQNETTANGTGQKHEPVELTDATIQLDRKNHIVSCKVTRSLYDDVGALRSTERVELKGSYTEDAPAKIRDVDAAKFGAPRLLGYAECVPDRFGQKCATVFVNVIYDAQNNYKQFHAVFTTPQAQAENKSAAREDSNQLSDTTKDTANNDQTPMSPTAPVIDDDIYDPVGTVIDDDSTSPSSTVTDDDDLSEGDSHEEDAGSGSFASDFDLDSWDEVKQILPNPYSKKSDAKNTILQKSPKALIPTKGATSKSVPTSTAQPPTPKNQEPSTSQKMSGVPQTSSGIPLKLTGGGTAVNSHENGRIDQVGTLFPPNGFGAVRVSPENRGYGNGFAVDFVEQTSRSFSMSHPECGLFTINQISKPGGGQITTRVKKNGKWVYANSHATHFNGLDYDISYFGKPHTDYVTTGKQTQKGRKNGKTRVVTVAKISNNFNYDCFLKYTKFMYDQKFANIDSRNNGVEIVDLIWVNRAIQNGVCEYVKNNNLKNEYNDALSLIYPEDGHESHFHLRLRCSPKHNGCYTRDFDRQLPFRKRGCRNL